MTVHQTSSSHQLWLMDAPLLLASASTTRRDMLTRSGVALETCAARIDERALEIAHMASGAMASDLAASLARAKAVEVSFRFPARLVLGADQTLDCAGELFHKPPDHEMACRQLASLAGREHRLTSAYCLVRDGQVLEHGQDIALMRMRAFGQGFLERYLDLAGDGVLASVGCYQLEGAGSQLFESFAGDHFTVLGLPLLHVLASLRRLGGLAE